MRTVRVREVAHRADAGEQLSKLPPKLVEAIYTRANSYVGQEHAVGEHVEFLRVDEHAIRLSLFVDTDGTLWIERLGKG